MKTASAGDEHHKRNGQESGVEEEMHGPENSSGLVYCAVNVCLI